MKVFLSVKYHADLSNREDIEHILDLVEACGHTSYCVVRDLEKWGAEQYEEHELMRQTLLHIRDSHLVLVETTEKGVGIGIEAGYAHARGIKIVALARKGSDISPTLRGIAHRVYLYESFEDLRGFIAGMDSE